MPRSSSARVGPFSEHERIHVIIETPSGSRAKYAWNPVAEAFELKRLLPLGMTFPYDFGFVPGTKANDGDPLDALVLSDAPLAVGCLVDCRVLGALEVKIEGVRNDRLIVVPKQTLQGASWHHLADLGEPLVREIGEFLRTYVERQDRPFELVRRVDRAAALALVEAART